MVAHTSARPPEIRLSRRNMKAMPAARPHTSEMAIRLARDNFGFLVFVSMIYFLTFSRFAQKNTRKMIFRVETLMP